MQHLTHQETFYKKKKLYQKMKKENFSSIRQFFSCTVLVLFMEHFFFKTFIEDFVKRRYCKQLAMLPACNG